MKISKASLGVATTLLIAAASQAVFSSCSGSECYNEVESAEKNLKEKQKQYEKDSIMHLEYSPNALAYRAKVDLMTKYRDEYANRLYEQFEKEYSILFNDGLSDMDIYQIFDAIKFYYCNIPNERLYHFLEELKSNKIDKKNASLLLKHFLRENAQYINDSNLAEMNDSINVNERKRAVANGDILNQSRADRDEAIRKLKEAKKAQRARDDKKLQKLEAQYIDLREKRISCKDNSVIDEFRKIGNKEYQAVDSVSLDKQIQEIKKKIADRRAELGCN